MDSNAVHEGKAAKRGREGGKEGGRERGSAACGAGPGIERSESRPVDGGPPERERRVDR